MSWEIQDLRPRKILSLHVIWVEGRSRSVESREGGVLWDSAVNGERTFYATLVSRRWQSMAEAEEREERDNKGMHFCGIGKVVDRYTMGKEKETEKEGLVRMIIYLQRINFLRFQSNMNR